MVQVQEFSQLDYSILGMNMQSGNKENCSINPDRTSFFFTSLGLGVGRIGRGAEFSVNING